MFSHITALVSEELLVTAFLKGNFKWLKYIKKIKNPLPLHKRADVTSSWFKKCSDAVQPAQDMTTAVEKIKMTIPSSRKTGCWLSLYSRWVVSCSPAPWHFYGNKMFVFVYWVAPAKWKALTLYCLTFSLDWLTSHDLFTMEFFFFYLFKNRSSSCPYAPRTQ